MNKFVAKYGRILVPLITPYGENEEVDYVQYEKLIDYIITNKLGDSLIVTGTTGEASLLTFDERVKLMETAINAAAGRMPVIAGTGCASTKETIALTQKAEELGIETCLVVVPFYNKPTQEGIYLILLELKMKLESIQHRLQTSSLQQKMLIQILQFIMETM